MLKCFVLKKIPTAVHRHCTSICLYYVFAKGYFSSPNLWFIAGLGFSVRLMLYRWGRTVGWHCTVIKAVTQFHDHFVVFLMLAYTLVKKCFETVN